MEDEGFLLREHRESLLLIESEPAPLLEKLTKMASP